MNQERAERSAGNMLEGKVCMISGAGSGIGRAAAIAASREGARLVLIGRRAAEVESTASMTGNALPIAADVTDPASLSRAIDASLKAYGRIDCAFNNAGQVPAPAPVAHLDEDELRAVMEVNLFGLFHAMQRQIPIMLDQGGGTIVNIASVGGLVGSPGNGAYCASKHALIGLSRSAALETAASGIRINVVCPGIVDTQMTAPLLKDPATSEMLCAAIPAGRVAQADEIAECVVWLMSEQSTFITGAVVPVDGGYAAV